MNDKQHGQGEDLVVVYKAPSEAVANIVASLLECEGISTTIISSATKWGERAAVVDSLERRQNHYWGDVVVAEWDVQKSLEIISVYKPTEETEPAKTQLYWQECYKPSMLRMPCAFMALFFCGVGFLTWYCDSLLQACMTFTMAFSSILYSWSISSSLKYVPSQYQRDHKMIGRYVMIGGLLFLLLGLQSVGIFPLSTSIAVAIDALASAAFIFGVAKKYPSAPESGHEHE